MVQANLFENLRNMETLSLRNNNVSTLNSDSFKGLVSLQLLDLHWHVLETLEADWFDDLISLTNLRLDGIDTIPVLKVLKPFQFKTLNKTEKLSLEENLIQKLEASTFQGLSSLEYLYLQKNFYTNCRTQRVQGIVFSEEALHV